MARIQMTYYGLGNATLDVVVPQYGDRPEHAAMTAEAFYAQKFPVLWLLHDAGWAGCDWLRHTLAELYAAQRDLIVVCPTIEHCFGVNAAQGDPWEDFIVHGLRDLLMPMLPMRTEPSGHTLCGLGQGGYAALRLAMCHPDCYGHAVAMDAVEALSPALMTPEQLAYVFGSEAALGAPDLDLKALAAQADPAQTFRFIRSDGAAASAVGDALRAAGCTVTLTACDTTDCLPGELPDRLLRRAILG